MVSSSRLEPFSKILNVIFLFCLLLFFLFSAEVICKDSFEFDAITFALNNTSALSNITIDLRTFNATEPANNLFKQDKILIRSDEELTLKTSAS